MNSFFEMFLFYIAETLVNFAILQSFDRSQSYCLSFFQVSQRSMHALSEWYEFEKRGEIFVKGKDNMTTYLLVGKKERDL